MIRTTLIGGIFFLIPLGFIVFILGQVFAISRKALTPLEQKLPPDMDHAALILTVAAIVLLLVLCFLAGLAAQIGPIARRVNRLDALLTDILPGYAVAKSTLGGIADVDDAMGTLRAVLVRFDDHSMIAFEVERLDNTAIVFLPGAPSAWSGTCAVVALDRIAPLNLPTHQVTGLLRVLGRGARPIIEAQRARGIDIVSAAGD